MTPTARSLAAARADLQARYTDKGVAENVAYTRLADRLAWNVLADEIERCHRYGHEHQRLVHLRHRGAA